MGADCEIRFENFPDKIVCGGQQVAGVIDINAHNVVRLQRLVLYIEGVGECEWRESRDVRDENGHTRTEYTYFRGRDQYLNTITHLIQNETELQPGRHVYNFMFLVPPEAPTSVQEENGRIYYRARVVFDRPWKFDLEFMSDFVVVRPIDLNFDPQLRIPLQLEEMKRYCCLFCASDPVVLAVSIPQSGYIAGQPIPIRVSINNPSTVNINHVELTLVKHITYTSEYPVNTLYRQVNIKYMTHGSSFNSCKKEYNVEMIIPPTIPSTLNPLVRVLNIHYMLYVKAKTPGCHMSPNVSFPIVIGTVPIGQQESFATNGVVEIQYPNAMTMPPPSAIMNNEFSNVMMPPSVPMNNQFSNIAMPPISAAPMNNDFSKNMMPPSAPMNNQFPNNMMPAIPAAPSAPYAPPNSDQPPSFDEASKLMPSVNAENSYSNNSGQRMGFVIPSSDEKKS